MSLVKHGVKLNFISSQQQKLKTINLVENKSSPKIVTTLVRRGTMSKWVDGLMGELL